MNATALIILRRWVGWWVDVTEMRSENVSVSVSVWDDE